MSIHNVKIVHFKPYILKDYNKKLIFYNFLEILLSSKTYIRTLLTLVFKTDE